MSETRAAELQLYSTTMAVVRGLVDRPDQVRVTIEGRSPVRLEVAVAAGELGQVVGRDGRLARSLRTILAGVAKKNGTTCELNIVQGAEQGTEARR